MIGVFKNQFEISKTIYSLTFLRIYICDLCLCALGTKYSYLYEYI